MSVFVVLISNQPDLSNETVDCDSTERLKTNCMCMSCCTTVACHHETVEMPSALMFGINDIVHLCHINLKKFMKLMKISSCILRHYFTDCNTIGWSTLTYP